MQIDSWVFWIMVIALGLNGLWALLQIGILRMLKLGTPLLTSVIWAWALTMSGLIFLQAAAAPEWEPFLRHWLYFPLSVQMAWNLLFVLVLDPVLLLILLVMLVVRLFRRKAVSAPVEPEGMSRRKFVYLVAYGAAPATALGMGVHGTLTRHDLSVREFKIPVANLPPEMEGFTIAHVSDLHSGIFCGPARLKIIREMTNDLKADLVAVTGDVINSDMGEFDDALAAIQGMGSRYGTYLCEGNHDRIPGPNIVREALDRHQLPMLFNANAIVPVHGRRLILGGLPWMRQGFEGRPEIVSSLFPERQEGDVRVLLAHYPHLFDIADSADLVLSGHTHGGQVMLGEKVGLGPMFFKYWSGLYQRGNTTMIVSNGCGDWFPCRIGAPAEIGLLRLTKAKAV